MSKDRVVGLLTRSGLIAKVASSGLSAKIQDPMHADFPVADPTDTLESVVSHLQESEIRTVPIVQGRQLLGLLTLDHLAAYLLTQAAIKPAANDTRVKQLLLREGISPV